MLIVISFKYDLEKEINQEKIHMISTIFFVKKFLSPCFFKKWERYNFIENWPLKRINHSLSKISEIFEWWFKGYTENFSSLSYNYIAIFEIYIFEKHSMLSKFWNKIFNGELKLPCD